ncbi:hypothetical protein [Spirillospora sp. NPDC048819]|uniref:hypothetical protein n=1 Tax=Spirillospora sp. NPDC048819 TaxID=3155268 RepID=UPI0033F1DB86
MEIDPAAALEERFPTWWVWVSDTGAWWASRRDQLTFADVNAGLVSWLRADTSDDLAVLLCEQNGLSAANPLDPS